MIVNKVYKFRIYPNKVQEILIAKTIGCSRFVYNHFLAQWNDTYKETGKGVTYNFCSAGHNSQPCLNTKRNGTEKK